MSRVIPAIVERHVDEASFLWERRQRACESPLFDLSALTELDDRLEANLEGITIARNIGLQKATDSYERANTPAELFVAAYAAAELDDTMTFARLLVASEKLPGGASAVVSALAWLSPARADKILRELLGDDCPPHLHCLGMAGFVARRQDPGGLLERAAASSNRALRAHAFRAAGKLGRRDMLPALRAEIRAGAREAEPWAIWSAVLLGETTAVPVLWHVAETGSEVGRAACDLAVRCVEASEAAARLGSLSRAQDTLQIALVGAAARGDPVCIPWVLDVLEGHPDHSRRAAWVYATITGAALEPPLAVRLPSHVPSDQLLTRVLLDPYEDLPAPDIAAIRAHWDQVRTGLVAGERRLGGRKNEPTWLMECVRTGGQPWRASAALEIALAAKSGGLFSVTARGRLQKIRIETWEVTTRGRGG